MSEERYRGYPQVKTREKNKEVESWYNFKVYMNKNSDTIEKKEKSTWNFFHLFLAVLIGILLQSIILPCLCGIGNAKMIIALIFDLFIFMRIVLAILIREKNKGWIYYCILCYASAFIIELASMIFLPH